MGVEMVMEGDMRRDRLVGWIGWEIVLPSEQYSWVSKLFDKVFWFVVCLQRQLGICTTKQRNLLSHSQGGGVVNTFACYC